MSDDPWHEDPAFWGTLEGLLFPPEKLDAAADELDALLSLADVGGGRVLDVPCGVGRHAVELADRGFEVTGVDPEFVEADMRAFARREAFDLVLNVYTSFGYFEDRADDRRTARNFHESLAEGGRLVMSLTSKEVVAERFQERTWSEQNGTYLLEEHDVQDDWSWMENRWVVVEDGETRKFTVSHRLYSAHELSTLLESVGFESVKMYGDWQGAPFDQDAERLVVVAEK